MEHEIMLTGVGGQSIQLAAQVLGRAAMLEGRHVMLLGTYGGSMRGGNTDSTLVVGDGPIEAPPLVSRVGCALAMHHRFWEPVAAKLRPDALVVYNETLFQGEIGGPPLRPIAVKATETATGLGQPLAASLVLIAAFARATGFASLDSLIAGMRASLPSYRQQYAADNEEALRAGHQLAADLAHPLWTPVAA